MLGLSPRLMISCIGLGVNDDTWCSVRSSAVIAGLAASEVSKRLRPVNLISKPTGDGTRCIGIRMRGLCRYFRGESSLNALEKTQRTAWCCRYLAGISMLFNNNQVACRFPTDVAQCIRCFRVQP
jgi:hypothetical protein